MFNNIKLKIKELASIAVVKAEEALGSNKGQQKKEMAIKFIIDKIPIPSFFKPIISVFLSSFIDDAVELAVEYMKNGFNSQE